MKIHPTVHLLKDKLHSNIKIINIILKLKSKIKTENLILFHIESLKLFLKNVTLQQVREDVLDKE